MNCLECRRALLTQPRARDTRVAAHLRECAACARLAGEQLQFEQQLDAALRVPVPENLRERVRFAASMRPRRVRRWLAAAAVVAALATGLSLGGREYQTSQTLTRAIASRMQEPAASDQTLAITSPRLARLAQRLKAYLAAADMGRVVSARESMIHGREAAEFYIVHGQEHARIFMMPDASLTMAHDVQADGIPGKLIPLGDGVIGVFCPDRRMLARFAANVRQSMDRRG
ncbi:DUF3379 family protein [Salinisphaera aquimarina]|uniref:DUF3379 family protein n=1 Tax=Salinisphaera aquimarina TaxID=2094031 RepID=A0ABV7ETN6_9GAMM